MAEVVPIVPPSTPETGFSAQFSAQQASTAISPEVPVTQKLKVTYLQLDWDGTQEGAIVVYFGAGDFVRGVNKTLFDGGGHPTATTRGGFVATKDGGWYGGAGEELRITTGAAIDPLSVTVWYALEAA